jgi:aryl-alcohol dehydrogenase-like predicted oxidoreductase
MQPLLSLIHRDAAAHEIPWCAEHSTGVICYSPMQSGLLTDAYQTSVRDRNRQKIANLRHLLEARGRTSLSEGTRRK